MKVLHDLGLVNRYTVPDAGVVHGEFICVPSLEAGAMNSDLGGPTHSPPTNPSSTLVIGERGVLS